MSKNIYINAIDYKNYIFGGIEMNLENDAKIMKDFGCQLENIVDHFAENDLIRKF
ncbi:hypothetical protein RM545_00490 [Zunongwangia sp. F260]|uniref:Uncharacterized protein n=1 Tax=Autumnicola lenta TaxID=3075593 RepID=A0ABU3CFN3_9FLAO|nr:hypothetical protein [Zunongwangia sp. F260]MDT0645154.1 hypothetical protein [Zunongwangia sp. F260]